MTRHHATAGSGFFILLLLVVGLPTAWAAQDGAAGEGAAEPDPMVVLHGYAGEWACEAEWSWGGTINARNIYEPVFDGKHMRALTYVSDNGGPEYLRYETLYSYNAETEQYVYTTVAYDGSVETGVMELREDGFHIEAERPMPDGGTLKMRQYIALAEDHTYAWRVSMQGPDGSWVVVMDDAWERVPAEAE